MKITRLLCLSLVLIALLFVVLCIPYNEVVCNDGGTKVYTSVICKIVVWNRITENGMYTHTSAYYCYNSTKTVDELWELELADGGGQYSPTGGIAHIEPIGDLPDLPLAPEAEPVS